MKKNIPSRYHSAFTALKSWARLLALPIAIFVSVLNLQAQSLLLKDINATEDFDQDEYSYLMDGYDKIYFINNGTELWKTTGNEGGP